MRRRALLQTAAIVLLAGCAGGGSDDTTPTGTDATGGTPTDEPTTTTTFEHTMATVDEDDTRTATPTPTGSVSGTVSTDGWTAERLVGAPDPAANTLSVQGSIRNGTGTTHQPSAALYDFLDGSGTEIAASRNPFSLTVEVPPGATFSLQQTVEFDGTDVTRIDRMAVGIETPE